MYDLVLIGSYTKDTIVSKAGTRLVDGGGFNYGAHASRLLGLKTAAVTRLAREDAHVVEALVAIGVDVYPAYTPCSTHLQLYYPTDNVDERIISVTQTAGDFTSEQVSKLQGRAFLANASMRGEVGLEVLQELKKKGAWLVADAQGFVRVLTPDTTLSFAPWPQKQEVLALIDIFKTDAVEAESLTGLTDHREAAKVIAGWGPQEVVLTHRDGLLVLAAGSYYEAPFCPRRMVGRSGRGDTCIASYVAKRLTAPPDEATHWAAAVTSLKMEAEGPIRKSLAEAEEFLQTQLQRQ